MTNEEAVVAYILDVACSHTVSSGIPAVLEKLAEEIAKEEHVTSRDYGSLSDLEEWVDELADNRVRFYARSKDVYVQGFHGKEILLEGKKAVAITLQVGDMLPKEVGPYVMKQAASLREILGRDVPLIIVPLRHGDSFEFGVPSPNKKDLVACLRALDPEDLREVLVELTKEL